MAKGNRKVKTKKILGLILAVVVLFSLCFEFFNVDYLYNSPFDKDFKWESPTAVDVNDEGYMGVIDSLGTRVSLVSPNGKVRTVIQHAMLQNVTPEYGDSISVGDDTITVVDHVHNINNNENNKDYCDKDYYGRVLVYDFKGNLTEMAYSDEDDEDISVYSAVVRGKKTYVTAYDESMESIVIGYVNDGEIKPIHEFKHDSADIFGLRYNPSNDMTVLLTNSGDVIAWNDEDVTEHVFSEKNAVIADAVAADDGQLIAIDSSGNSIVAFESTDKLKVLASTEALNLSTRGDTIIYGDQNRDSIGIIDGASGHADVISGAEYSNRIKAACIGSWVIFLVGSISFIILAALIIAAIAKEIKNSRNQKKENVEDAHKEKPLTNIELYGPLMAVAFLAFAITAVMIGGMYFNSAVNASRVTATDVSRSIMYLSGDSFGDSMKKMKSQRDFGSHEHAVVMGYVEAACVNGTLDGAADLNCSLYKFMDDSDDIMVISDPSRQMKTGTIVSKSDQKEQKIDRAIKSILEGKVKQDRVRFSNGVRYYKSYSPIYDSSGDIVAFCSISINETKFRETVFHGIMMKLIQAFTLIFGLVLLFIEFGLARRFLKIKRENTRNGLINKTVPESFRTIDIMFKIPGALFIIFIYAMVDEIMTEQGMVTSALFVALPITINAIAFFVFRIVIGHYVKFAPRRYAYISAACTIVASTIILLAMKQESYLLLNVSAAVMGTGSAIGMISAKSIRLALNPSTRYLYIVVERKALIATAIAASLGTVLRGMFGETSIVFFLYFVAVIAIISAFVFMYDDINVPKDGKNEERSTREFHQLYRKMLKRKNTFVFMVLVSIPLPFLTLLGTYVLPQLNSFYGLPEVFIGAITLVVSAVTLLLSSSLWNIVRTKKDEYWPPIMMGALAVILLLFSLITTMKLFIIVLIAVALTESILQPLSLKQIISETIEEGHDPRDTSPMHEFFLAIGVLLGPVLMTLTMMIDVSLIGLIWGIICIVCAIAAARIFSKEEKW